MREPYLLTPGPATTDLSVKTAMLRDWGSWDDDFRAITARIRRRLVNILGPAGAAFECVPMQGSGSFVVEAMLGSLIPRDGKALVLMNGAYGKRIARTLTVIGRAFETLDKGDYLPPQAAEVDALLAADPTLTHVVVVHCETSSGILNPVEDISKVVASHRRHLLIDAMSSFGAIDLDPARIRYDAVVASANKCLEGVPGFGWALVRRDVLEASDGNAHSLSLDLADQWRHMEATANGASRRQLMWWRRWTPHWINTKRKVA